MASAAFGAGVSGKWTGERQTKKGSAPILLELKADGAALTGSMSQGRRGRSLPIKDGKVNGDSFTFTVMQKSKQGERAADWEGTVAGDQLQLKAAGRKRAKTLTLKRSGE